MDPAEVDALIEESRAAIYSSDAGDLLRRISAAIDEADRPGVRGRLLLARALMQQGNADLSAPAADAAQAAALHREAGEPGETALAAAGAAVLWQRAGDHGRCVDLAVDSFVALADTDLGDQAAIRARNALAVLLGQLCAFELAYEASTTALTSLVDSDITDDIVECFSLSTLVYAISQAHWAGVELDHSLARRTVDRLLGSELELPRYVAAVSGLELDLLRPETDRDWSTVESVVERSRSATMPARFEGWHLLLLGQLRRRQHRALEALAVLDETVPLLEDAGDDHLVFRALDERAKVKAQLGDHEGAYADSSLLSRRVRLAQVDQVGRLALQITRRAELEVARSALRHRADQLAREVSVDALTGVGSRRWLDLRIGELSALDVDGSAIVIDLDHFKAINDRYGHDTGDQVLRVVGRILGDGVRESDIVARYGGEEFVMVLIEASEAVATTTAERLREAIRSQPWGEVGLGLSVSASFGVASGPLASLRELLLAADAALYEAKRSGRDRIVTAA